MHVLTTPTTTTHTDAAFLGVASSIIKLLTNVKRTTKCALKRGAWY